MTDVQDDTSNRGVARGLIFAVLCEAVCVAGGLIAYFVTQNWIWILIGVFAGAGLALPATIKYFRETRGRDSASR